MSLRYYLQDIMVPAVYQSMNAYLILAQMEEHAQTDTIHLPVDVELVILVLVVKQTSMNVKG